MFSLAACLALFAANEAQADIKDELSGPGGMAVPLQKLSRKERPRGVVYVSIPIAYVFGLGGEHDLTYCSPTVRADNSSNKPVEELVVGIEYQTRSGQTAGGTITRFDKIKVGKHDSQYFYKLPVTDCKELEGKLTVVHCIYSSGDRCSDDVQASSFGSIPLTMKLR